MAKVYIINDMNHNFDKAKKLGELVYVTQGRVPFFKTDVVKNMLRDGLKDFNASEDYLLLTGPQLMCVMATLQLFNDSVDCIQTLTFDAKLQDYVVRHVGK